MEKPQVRSLPQPGETWKHYKGGEYKIICIALDEVSKSQVRMIYESLQDGQIWDREYNLFMNQAKIVRVGGQIELVNRFEKISDASQLEKEKECMTDPDIDELLQDIVNEPTIKHPNDRVSYDGKKVTLHKGEVIVPQARYDALIEQSEKLNMSGYDIRVRQDHVMMTLDKYNEIANGIKSAANCNIKVDMPNIQDLQTDVVDAIKEAFAKASNDPKWRNLT